MRFAFTLTLILILTSIHISAQEYLPFASSNYAGVTGVSLQPASIADSRYKFDMAISSSNFSVYNNFYSIDPYVLWHPTLLKDLDFKGRYVSRNMDGSKKTGIISLKQDFFSFMVSLSDKDAIAFTPSVRVITNVDNMKETTAVLLDQLDTNEEFWQKKLKDENIYAQSNIWAEYAFTYARIILDKQSHFLKAGVSLKINQGIGSAYLFVKDLNYEVNGKDTISFYNSYTNYGASDNFVQKDFTYKFNANPSLSFDFGVVYEYRPQWMNYKQDMNGKQNIWRKDKDKYLLRVGFTVADLGNVRYQRNELSRDFNADIHKWDISDVDITSVSSFNALIDTTFTYYEVSNKYNMTLPINLSLQADVRILEGLYINVTPYLALNRGAININKVHYLSTLNIVPRYDKAWYGVSLPVQYNAYNQWNIGLGLRLGPVWLGWNDMFTMLASKENRYGTSFSMILKVPILYKNPHDRDNDNISDKNDDCPDVAGVTSLNGCPDADNDGVTDAKDNCPNEPGIKNLNGCPDMDSDGVVDKYDLCPQDKGIEKFSGCPDSDGDSIIDKNDQCPFNAGLASLMGCPDQDGDGISDKDDNCPTIAGTRENKGCPFLDNDGDGVKNEWDKCPDVKGAEDNYGCPYPDMDEDSVPDKDDECPSIFGLIMFKGCPDTDGDGVSDKNDLCPSIPGLAVNSGCPEIKKEEQDVLNTAFNNLEFETGKSVISSSSHKSLDGLVDVMKKRSDFKLALSGYTDNVGKPHTNLTLSKNRTLAVKNYLTKKGIAPERIKTDWFGDANPIAPNTTPDGRQKNRRVEMKIFFE